MPARLYRFFPLLLFVMALLPRLVPLGRYVTPDEAIWVYRSIQFREALLDGRWADTLVAGHPGVTTTWLGALGMSAQRLLDPVARADYDWLARMAYLTPDNVEAYRRLATLLTGGRVAVTLVNALGVVGVYWLAKRLAGARVAIAAGLLLAFDPFLVGLSGLLHVDGLSATFATLSLLALLVGLDGGGRGWIAISGALAGLAALTKTPTLLLLPVSGLALLWASMRRREQPMSVRFQHLVGDVLAWGAAFGLMILFVFPAAWASPVAVLATVGGSANRHLDEALRETFFLGRAAFDHGPLFYPVVLLWRLSPVVWLALIPTIRSFTRWRRGEKPTRSGLPLVVLLSLWAVLFLLAITPAAKKFDRYILPVVPALLLLAAYAWARWGATRRGGGRWVVASVVVIQLVYWLFFAGYPLTAYNPLVGGPYTAERVLPIGWGEGIGAAGSRLSREQPDAAVDRAIAGVLPSFAPFFVGYPLVEGLDDPATADYVVVTLGGRQLAPGAVAAQTANLDLVAVEHFGGLDQAWTYRNPLPRPPVVPPQLDEPIRFGDRLALVAYGREASEDAVKLGLQWQRLGAIDPEERYLLRVAIGDTHGNVWSATETDLLNEVYFFPADWESDVTGPVRFILELPPGLPPGTYQVALSVIDVRTAAQLPVRTESGQFLGVSYPAGEIVVTVPESIVTASRMQIARADGRTWLDGRLQLLGYDEMAEAALAGSRLPVDLFWHVPLGVLPAGLQLEWLLRPESSDAFQPIHKETLSRYDTGLWRTGESIHEKYRVPLPPNLAPGRYVLAIRPSLASGEPIGPVHELAELDINNITRAYTLPADVVVALDSQWEPLTLVGMSPGELAASPGDSPEVTLYWKKNAAHGEVYSVFVHLLNEDGRIVAQADHWPGGLPTDILDAGQIVTDRFGLPLPAHLAPGTYRMRIGLYLTESGVRLPVLSDNLASEPLSEGDSIVLPVVLRVDEPDGLP